MRREGIKCVVCVGRIAEVMVELMMDVLVFYVQHLSLFGCDLLPMVGFSLVHAFVAQADAVSTCRALFLTLDLSPSTRQAAQRRPVADDFADVSHGAVAVVSQRAYVYLIRIFVVFSPHVFCSLARGGSACCIEVERQ